MISIPHVKEEQHQLVVHFLLDICCIPHVDKASVNEIYFEEHPVKQAPVTSTVTNTENKDQKTQENTQPKTERVKKERDNVCILKVADCTYGLPQTTLNV